MNTDTKSNKKSRGEGTVFVPPLALTFAHRTEAAYFFKYFNFNLN